MCVKAAKTHVASCLMTNEYCHRRKGECGRNDINREKNPREQQIISKTADRAHWHCRIHTDPTSKVRTKRCECYKTNASQKVKISLLMLYVPRNLSPFQKTWKTEFSCGPTCRILYSSRSHAREEKQKTGSTSVWLSTLFLRPHIRT